MLCMLPSGGHTRLRCLCVLIWLAVQLLFRRGISSEHLYPQVLSPTVSIDLAGCAGAKEAENILGEGCTEVAPLYDQLAMISFFHDRSVLGWVQAALNYFTSRYGMRYSAVVTCCMWRHSAVAFKPFNV